MYAYIVAICGRKHGLELRVAKSEDGRYGLKAGLLHRYLAPTETVGI